MVCLQILSRPLLQVVIPAGQAQVRLVNLAKVSLEYQLYVYKIYSTTCMQTPFPS
jgi:hypothetical protein